MRFIPSSGGVDILGFFPHLRSPPPSRHFEPCLSVMCLSEVRWCSDLFSQTFWTRQSGQDGLVEEMVVSTNHRGEQKKCIRFASLCSAAHIFTARWPVPSLSAFVGHTVARFHVPRCGACCWWRLTDLFNNFRLGERRPRRKRPGTHWISKRVQSWEQMCSINGKAKPAIQRGIPSTGDVADRVTDWSSCGTWSFLMILVRLGYSTQNLGRAFVTRLTVSLPGRYSPACVPLLALVGICISFAAAMSHGLRPGQCEVVCLDGCLSTKMALLMHRSAGMPTLRTKSWK